MAIKWPHICGRSTGWKRVVFTVREQWRALTRYYELRELKVRELHLRDAYQKISDDIDRKGLEIYRAALPDDCGAFLCVRPKQPLAPLAFLEFCGKHRRLRDAYLRGNISDTQYWWTP